VAVEKKAAEKKAAVQVPTAESGIESTSKLFRGTNAGRQIFLIGR